MDVLSVNWQQLFKLTVPPLELIVRGSLMYLALFFLLRTILRREAGSVSVPDLLMVVLLADAAQNAIAGDYQSITDGLILVSTIVFLNYSVDRLAYQYPAFGRLVHPAPLLLIKNGQLVRKNLRREFITEEELKTQLREQGVEEISQVSCAYIEGDGRISVIPKE